MEYFLLTNDVLATSIPLSLILSVVVIVLAMTVLLDLVSGITGVDVKNW